MNVHACSIAFRVTPHTFNPDWRDIGTAFHACLTVEGDFSKSLNKMNVSGVYYTYLHYTVLEIGRWNGMGQIARD